MKRNVILLVILLLPILVIGQKAEQTAALRSEQSRVQGLAKAIIGTWDPKGTQYTTAMLQYNDIEAEFNGWIDFCYGLGEEAITKKGKIDEAAITEKTEFIVSKSNEFKQFFIDNNEAARLPDSRGDVVVEAANSAVDLVANIINMFGENKKKKKEEQLLKLKEKLDGYKIQSWKELEDSK